MLTIDVVAVRALVGRTQCLIRLSSCINHIMYLYFVQDVLNGLDLDLEGYWLDDSCLTGGSYWAGKDISMVARAASISRAFGTDHYLTFDASLRTCLDKWIRVDGGCSSHSSYI